MSAATAIETPSSITCMECRMKVEPANAYHPYIFCVLYKLGVPDPARFLDAHGWIPDPERLPEARVH